MTSLNTGVREVLITRVKNKKSVELTPALREVTFAKNDVPQTRGEIFTAILVLVQRATLPSGSFSFLKPTFYPARTP